jgi:hypothetical protein
VSDARLREAERLWLASRDSESAAALNRAWARTGARGSHPLLRDPRVEPAPGDVLHRCVTGKEKHCTERMVEATSPSGVVFYRWHGSHHGTRLRPYRAEASIAEWQTWAEAASPIRAPSGPRLHRLTMDEARRLALAGHGEGATA